LIQQNRNFEIKYWHLACGFDLKTNLEQVCHLAIRIIMSRMH
jgi:hypothetical protein